MRTRATGVGSVWDHQMYKHTNCCRCDHWRDTVTEKANILKEGYTSSQQLCIHSYHNRTDPNHLTTNRTSDSPTNTLYRKERGASTTRSAEKTTAGRSSFGIIEDCPVSSMLSKIANVRHRNRGPHKSLYHTRQISRIKIISKEPYTLR